MNIIKTKDHAVIKYILNKIDSHIEKESIVEYNQQIFIKWLRYALPNPLLGVWVCLGEEDKELVTGYIIVQIQQSLTTEHINIIQLFGDTDEIEDELLFNAEKWATEHGIKKMMTTTFYPKKWKDRGFEVKEHLVVKEV